MQISHIIFDIDGTLVDESARLLAQARAVAGTFGSSHQDMQSTIDAFFAANDRAVREGGLYKNDIAQYMLWMGEMRGASVDGSKARSLAVAWNRAYEASHEAPLLFPDVIPCLTALKEKGIQLIAASGGTAAKKEKLLSDTGVREYFSQVFGADDVGFQKQDVRFWETILPQIDAEPENIMVVGNQINDDIMHPQALGASTVLITRPEILKKNLGPKNVHADHTIDDLAALLELL